ncbi:MAG: DUF3014 domain-containing protein [Pseudomonadales bacterium]|nr:DUF3014 domain-containing protein [Pseudomonadales bacterium]MCP5329687.1 DUF3014 domain-containing protein [Pseudomonadales bacterium]MCP5343774.1 DUF3014 domain-containing protein [Pseudomonadales bacterium]
MNKSLAIIAAIAVIGLLFLVYLAATFESPQGTQTVEIAPPVPQAPAPVQREETPAPVPAPVQPVTPAPVVAVEEETPEPEVVEEIVELPTLNDSDGFLSERLQALETGARLMALLTSDDIIRKFVVFVDNVAEGNLPQLEYPVRRLPQAMAVRELDENLYEMQTVSYQRYTALIDGLTAVNPEQALAIYRVMKPLFQEAYAEIGYPNRNFDDTLARAIDNVVNASTAEGPFQLIKPKVMYIYADSEIERMSPVEKQLLRMGPQNAEKLKLALQQYRQRLSR